MSSLNESIGSKGVKETNSQLSRGIANINPVQKSVTPMSKEESKAWMAAETPTQVQDYYRKYKPEVAEKWDK